MATEEVKINIREVDNWVEITVTQPGKASSILAFPPDEAITYATNIIRIATAIRNSNDPKPN